MLGENQKKERSVFYKTFSFAFELGYTIVIPIVLLAFLGRFLDRKFETSPIFLLSGILFSIIVSGILIFRKAKKILDEAANL